MLDLKFIILCSVIAVIFITLIIIIVNILKSNKKEEEASILDVNEVGVEDKEFSYGYEKEETIVMPKVEEEKKEEEKGE